MNRSRVWIAVPLACLLAALWLGGQGSAAQSRRPDAPIITPAGGTYSLNAKVRVSIRGESGTCIVYTLNGDNPDHNSGIRAESNTIFFDLPPGDVTVKAAAIRPGLPKSVIRRAVFVRVDDRAVK